MLTTFTVLNLADSGADSLRSAILAAEANPGADVIDFADGLTGVIHLTNGQLSITDDLTIDGPGADYLAVSGNQQSRVFGISGGAIVSIADLTITAENEVIWTQPTSGDLVMQTILPEATLAQGKVGDTTSFKVITKSPKSFPLLTHEQQAYRQIDFVTLQSSFSRIKWGWFALGFLGYGVALALGGMRSHCALRLTHAASHFLASCRIFLVGHFLFLVLFGAAGGDLAKTAVYSRWYRFGIPEVLAAAAQPGRQLLARAESRDGAWWLSDVRFIAAPANSSR